MNNKRFVFFLLFSILAGLSAFVDPVNEDPGYVSYELNLRQQNLKLYWKDDNNNTFKSIGQLKNWLDAKGETLVFAMNGGMYKTDNSPLGLFIQDHKTLAPLNTRHGSGNFYLKPNGVFYITDDNKAIVCKTGDLLSSPKIKYATQSGPMLLMNGQVHPSFTKGSANVNIRNGVGILPNNNIIFAMSKKEVSFYDFADYFKKLGCKNALYLDGFVCRTYSPASNWVQTDGNFGVIIGVTKTAANRRW